MYIFWTGPRTESIKFGPPDRACFFGLTSDLEFFMHTLIEHTDAHEVSPKKYARTGPDILT